MQTEPKEQNGHDCAGVPDLAEVQFGRTEVSIPLKTSRRDLHDGRAYRIYYVSICPYKGFVIMENLSTRATRWAWFQNL